MLRITRLFLLMGTVYIRLGWGGRGQDTRTGPGSVKKKFTPYSQLGIEYGGLLLIGFL